MQGIYSNADVCLIIPILGILVHVVLEGSEEEGRNIHVIYPSLRLVSIFLAIEIMIFDN